MPTPQHPPMPLVFTDEELDLLGRTADALTAYMGKPVLAEIIDASETGFEWVVFGIPLTPHASRNAQATVQIGGSNARIVGSGGGLKLVDGETLDCEYLWAIQLSPLCGVRFIKLDSEGEEVAWGDELRDMLPFVIDNGDEEPPPTLH